MWLSMFLAAFSFLATPIYSTKGVGRLFHHDNIITKYSNTYESYNLLYVKVIILLCGWKINSIKIFSYTVLHCLLHNFDTGNRMTNVVAAINNQNKLRRSRRGKKDVAISSTGQSDSIRMVQIMWQGKLLANRLISKDWWGNQFSRFTNIFPAPLIVQYSN